MQLLTTAWEKFKALAKSPENSLAQLEKLLQAATKSAPLFTGFFLASSRK
ncbi:MAG: hypothetical protein HLUCCO02_05535 [Idiomarinaceae bacterium HL-53]|nr:MAG: hypothetical protein HLUCCO02_05535 [Idiomarinaceae bacterium HL-53]